MNKKTIFKKEESCKIIKSVKISKKNLQNFYGKKIPDPVDFITSTQQVKLIKYIDPFRCGKKLRERFGTDFDKKMPKLWESQFEEFYTEVIKKHWNSFYGAPRKGFKTIFRRACIAGIMSRCGFKPLDSIEQIEERKKKIDEDRIKQKKEKEATEKRNLLMYIRSENIARVALKFKQLPKEERNRIEEEFNSARKYGGIKDNFGLFLVSLAEKGVLDLGKVNLVTLENMEKEEPFLIFSSIF